MSLDKANWPRCLLWHGWLPMLSGVNGASLRPLMLLRVLSIWLKLLLVATLLVLLLSGVSLVVLMLIRLLHGCLMTPEVWSDGRLVLDSITGVSAAGAGLFAHQSEHSWSDRRWGHVDRIQMARVAHSCKGVLCLSLNYRVLRWIGYFSISLWALFWAHVIISRNYF